MSSPSLFGSAIGQAEGFGTPGAIPTLANNPGDLKLGDQGYGTLGQGITVFGSVEEGWQALEGQLSKITGGSSAYYSPQMTISQMGQIYSGGDPNWAKNVSAALGTNPSSPIGSYLPGGQNESGQQPNQSNSPFSLPGSGTGIPGNAPLTWPSGASSSNSIWARVAAGLIGLICVGAGVMMFRQTQTVIQTVTGLAKKGAALAAAVLLALALGPRARAQNTTATTAAVVDPDGQAWGNGTWTAKLYNPSGTQQPVYTNNGQPVPTLIQAQTLDASGNLSYAFPDNNKISPAGTRWDLTLCSQTSAPCSTTGHILITGSSMDISATVNGQLTAPRIGTGTNERGYMDAEVTTPVNQGGTYWNVSRGVYRVWNGNAWNDGSGGVSGAPVNGAACVNAALGNVTNGLNNCIQQQIATGKRGTMMIDSTVGNGSPTLSLTSLNRVSDMRGTNCMDQFGSYTYTDNAFCNYAVEDRMDPPSQTVNSANYDFSYDSEKGAVYTSSSDGHGYKSNRANINIYSTFRTTAQSWGINQSIEGFAGGEIDPYSAFMEVYSGYLGYGQEGPTLFRGQVNSGQAKDGVGGVFQGTITAISGNTVTFTSTDVNVRTLGEARIIRDLTNSYSTGSIGSVACSGSPNICTVTGTGTAWTSIAGFVGTHTIYSGTGNSFGAPVATNNLTLCFTPNGNTTTGHDWCVPILTGINDTTLTVNIYNFASSQNSPWYGPTSGAYVIYHSCWPSSVGINVNAGQSQNYTFTSSDTTGLATGHNFDQVEAYNQAFLGGLILQQRDIGAPYFGGGWDVENYSDSSAPSMEMGYKVRGKYNYAIEIGSYDGTQTTAPAAAIGITQRGAGPMIFDTSPATTTPFTFFTYRDSTNTYQSAMEFFTNTAGPTVGLCFYNVFCIDPTGAISKPTIFKNGITVTGNAGNQDQIIAQGLSGSYLSCVGFSYSNATPNAQWCMGGDGTLSYYGAASGAPAVTGISLHPNGQVITPNLQYTYATTSTNCGNNGGSPVPCTTSPAGTILLFASTTSVTVNTSAVTAQSEIFVQFDASLGTRLGATCNTTYTPSWISARNVGVSFTITVSTAPTTNPICFSYSLIN